MIKSASLFVLIATLICGCGTSQNRALSGEQAVKLRHMQTRSFDTKDVKKAARDVISTMQDLGFIIDHADAGLGSMAVYILFKNNIIIYSNTLIYFVTPALIVFSPLFQGTK